MVATNVGTPRSVATRTSKCGWTINLFHLEPFPVAHIVYNFDSSHMTIGFK